MSLKSNTFIGFDTETTGKYPLESEVCEVAAVKYRDGQIVDRFQTLLKPRQLMNDEVIKIHGITNEMVEGAPRMSEKIAEFADFIKDGYLVAHHAPFDMGFLAIAFEAQGLPLPTLPVICSSRLSRQIITDSKNHKLQTLIPHLGITQGTAHRALDDATACLEVALRCFERGKLETLEQVFLAQAGELWWKDYSLDALKFKSKDFQILLDAIQNRKRIRLTYQSGSKPGRERFVEPIGIVRSIDGDFMVAYDESPQPKRFYLEKVAKIDVG